MKQNILYYRSYSQQWGLEDSHFTPRVVRAIFFIKALCIEYVAFESEY